MYTLQTGDLLLLHPNIAHKGYKVTESDACFYWLHFQGDEPFSHAQMSDMNNLLQIGTWVQKIYLPEYMRIIEPERLIILFNQLLDLSKSSNYYVASQDYMTTTLLIEIAHQFLKQSVTKDNALSRSVIDHMTPTDASLTDNFSKILEWTRIHLHENISLTRLSNEFNYSREYISRYFRQKTGMTYIEYIHRLRINQGKILLSEGKHSVKEIAFLLGFNDEKYFIRLFKKYEKMSPNKYRQAFYRTHLNNA